MSGTTEIYICKNGQKLKEGKLVVSNDVTNREQASRDAKERCKTDTAIERIAYYALSPDGDFRNFFTYTNPDAPAPSKPAKKGVGTQAGQRVKTKKPAKKSFFARLLAPFGKK